MLNLNESQNENEKEIWVEINGFSEYEISSYGNCRRKYTTTTPTGIQAYYYSELKPIVNKQAGNYLKYSLSVNGKKFQRYIHKLVADHFVVNPDPSVNTEIDHVNMDKNDNYYKNLQHVSRTENMKRYWTWKKEQIALQEAA